MKISMKVGPQQTDTAKFQGFGMKLGGSASSSSAPGRLPSAAAAKAKAKAAASGGASALFRQSMEDDDDPNKKAGVPCWSKPTLEAVQAQKQAEALLAADATIFQYDEVIDDVKADMDIQTSVSQTVRTNVLEQKKRTGLTLREGAEAVRSGSKRESKYIEKVIIATDRRRVEQQIMEDRLLKKEQQNREGEEVFVTSGFKEELKRRKKFEDELEAQDRIDQMKDAAKMEDGKGFASFHRAMLNGGLSSARGGEKIKEQAAVQSVFTSVNAGASQKEMADISYAKVEEDGEEVKEEKDTKKEEDAKAEDDDEKAGVGVLDVQAPTATPGSKAAEKLVEQEQRAEKAMSAKERYLARKRAAESAA